MAAERRPARCARRSNSGREVGDEPIVSRHQLVELAAARDVLVLEQLRLARGRRPEQRRRRSRRRCAASSARTPGKKRAMVANPCAMRRRAEDGPGAAAACSPVSRFTRVADRALPPHGPQLVAQVLLDERDLGLHRQLDVANAVGCGWLVRRGAKRGGGRHARQDPARAASGTSGRACRRSGRR